MQYESCSLCSSNKIKLLFKKQDIPFYGCIHCGFVFAKPAVNPNLQNTIDDFEPAYLNYFSEQPHDQKNHDAIIKKLLKYSSLKGKVLDIGCGSGKFVKHLRAKGYDAYGLEPSAALFDTFLKNDDYFFKDDVFSFQIKHPQRKFDAIVLTDVLEHIELPRSLIETVSTMLSPGGIVFISTPDTGSLLARIAGKRWHYYNKYHLSLFSRTNLDMLMQQPEHSCEKLAAGYVTRHQSVYYIMKYGLNFLLHMNKDVPRFLSGWHLPVNLFDNMYAVYRILR